MSITGNVAYGKTANQSGILNEWDASRAVDGGTNPDANHGSCAHPNRPNWNPALWSADLGHMHEIFNITLFTRDSDYGTSCTYVNSNLLNILNLI